MILEKPRVVNVKCRFPLQSTIVIYPSARCRVTRTKNLIVLRAFHYAFTIFAKNNSDRESVIFEAKSVNVTGIRNFGDIKQAVRVFNFITRQCIHAKEAIIDCTTASGSTKNAIPLNLSLIKYRLDQENKNFRVSFDPHFFPGAVLRQKGFGTVLLFASGKYVIVGAKSQKNIEDTHTATCRILEPVVTLSE